MANDGGLLSFQRRMKAIPEAAREAIKPALMREAYKIQDTMEGLAPEDDGDLKNSITVTGPGQSTPPYSQPGGSKAVPENTVAITVGSSDVRYAHLQEYGTRFHPPHAFFWPGFRLHRDKSLKAIKAAIGKAIREAK